MLPLSSIEVIEYRDARGVSLYSKWREGLDYDTRQRIATAVFRVQSGNFSVAKGVGKGVFELRLDFGPGYRVYFGKDGDLLVVLLGGGSKKRQSADVKLAHLAWNEYKQSKRSGDLK